MNALGPDAPIRSASLDDENYTLHTNPRLPHPPFPSSNHNIFTISTAVTLVPMSLHAVTSCHKPEISPKRARRTGTRMLAPSCV